MLLIVVHAANTGFGCRVGSVSRSYNTLSSVARYFNKVEAPINNLVSISTIDRFLRFIVFMLPFKALFVLISAKKVFLYGVTINSIGLAAIILLFSFVLFITHLKTKKIYSNLLDHAVSRQQEMRYSDGNKKTFNSYLRDVVDFKSSLLIALLLYLANIVVLPLTALMLLAMLVYICYLERILLRALDGNHVTPSETGPIVNYLSMVIIMLMIGSGYMIGLSINFLAALFVFISYRFITTSLLQAAAILFRNGVRPIPDSISATALSRFDNDKPLRIHPAPFFSYLGKNKWFELALRERFGIDDAVEKSYWNHSVGARCHGFVILLESNRSIFLSIFHGLGGVDFIREKYIAEKLGSSQLSLDLLGDAVHENYQLIAYDITGYSEIKHSDLQNARQSLMASLSTLSVDGHDGLIPNLRDQSSLLNTLSMDTVRAVSKTDEDLQLVDWLSSSVNHLENAVRSLPLSLSLPLKQAFQMRRDGNNLVKIMEFSGILLGPIGCGLGRSQSRKSLDIGEVLKSASELRPELGRLTVAQLEVCAHYYALVNSFKRRDWRNIHRVIRELKVWVETI